MKQLPKTLKSKVLIVEDDESISQALAIALEFQDFKVKVISQAKKTMAAIRSFKPDVILLDLLLSGENGGAIAQTLKKNNVTKKIPIILMSAHPTAEQIAQEAGVNGFLAKPFTMDYLFETIMRVMQT